MYFPKSKAGEGTSIVDDADNAFHLVNSEDERESEETPQNEAQEQNTDAIKQLDHHDANNLETDDETMITDNRSGEPIFTCTGRAVVMPSRYDDYAMMGIDESYKIELTEAEERYYDAMREVGYPSYNESEFGLIGAVGTGFTNTQELHAVTYDQAMSSSDKEHWEKSVDKEHDSIEKHKVF
jgi:hypothetical protein